MIWNILAIALMGVLPICIGIAGAVLEPSEPFFAAFFGWMFSLIGCAVLLGAITGIGLWSTHHSETKTFEMRSIATSTATQGRYTSSIFLGSGYISQEPVYYWYGVNPDGSLTLASVTAGISRIVETTDGGPRAVCRRNVSSWPFYEPYDDANDGTHCTFYVPPGSVASGVDLDIPK